MFDEDNQRIMGIKSQILNFRNWSTLVSVECLSWRRDGEVCLIVLLPLERKSSSLGRRRRMLIRPRGGNGLCAGTSLRTYQQLDRALPKMSFIRQNVFEVFPMLAVILYSPKECQGFPLWKVCKQRASLSEVGKRCTSYFMASWLDCRKANVIGVKSFSSCVQLHMCTCTCAIVHLADGLPHDPTLVFANTPPSFTNSNNRRGTKRLRLSHGWAHCEGRTRQMPMSAAEEP